MRVAALGLAAMVALLASLLAGGGGGRVVHGRTSSTRAAGAASPGTLPGQPPGERAQLVADLDRAQAIVDDASSSATELAGAGRFEQMATLELAHQPPSAARATLASLGAAARASMRADLAAASGLARLVRPHASLPPWRIIQPPASDRLLGYFKAAQRRSGVPWQYLAAIEFVETKFGRIEGPSDAGAQGPMQFLPATWARYGHGSIRSPRDAIAAAARYLAANGAPRDMASALYHYNPSSDYVSAVESYAGRMRADPRAYFGYYYWQVVFDRRRGLVILPVGFPKARPTPLRLGTR